jgi:hypothetical protein
VYYGCYGDLLPCANTTYNLGSTTSYWHNIYVDHVIGWTPTTGTGTGNVTTTASGPWVNYIPKYTSETNLNKSVMYENGSYIGVGSTNARRALDVLQGDGTAQARLTYTVDSIFTDLHTTVFGYFGISPSGSRVGINNTAPTQALDVTGNIYSSANVSLSGAYIKTNQVSARDLTIVTGSQKTLVLDTPVWDDLVVNMSNVKAPTANPPTWTAYKSSEVPAFNKDATNILYFSAQLQHTYKEGSDIEFHIHLSYPDNTSGNSTWVFTYSWANMGATFPLATSTGNVIIASPVTTDYHQLAQMATTISGTGKLISSVLLCSISRLGADLSDNYNNNIYLVSGDIHYQVDTMGSRQQLTK